MNDRGDSWITVKDLRLAGQMQSEILDSGFESLQN
jgi:hypothetical protein